MLKMLINTLIVLAIIVVIPLFIALFIKREYRIQREIIINKPVHQVFDYVKYLKNQESYSKWVMMDPEMKKDYRGMDGTVGFIYAWNGNNKAGEGEQEIKSMVENKRLDIEIRFKRPFKGIANTPLITDVVSENETRITWGMSGQYAYPMNLITLFIDSILGKDLEISLNNLKTILETNK